MIWTDFKRIGRSGLLNFKRNGIVSVASVLISTITLCVIASLIFLQAILHFSINEIQNKVDITVYFTVGADEARIETIKKTIENSPQVASVEYVSAVAALADFREKHKDDYGTMQALDELDDNPLGAYLNVRAIDTAAYADITSFIENNTTIQQGSMAINKISYHQNKLVIDRLISLMNTARMVGFIVTLVLGVMSILITFNTIRLAIFIAREEIAVMRLVGASTRYIQGPFMVEGVIYGIIAACISMFLFLPITYAVSRSLSTFLGLDLYQYYLSNFFQIFGILLVSGILISALSSFLAVRKYLQN